MPKFNVIYSILAPLVWLKAEGFFKQCDNCAGNMDVEPQSNHAHRNSVYFWADIRIAEQQQNEVPY